MEEQFETRPILAHETLRVLQQRRNFPSLIRLVIHLASIVGLTALLTADVLPTLGIPLVVVALAGAVATIFGAFHDSTHRSLFASSRANRVAAWVSGTLWQMAPAMYRIFHFEHHRHTQDPDRDPELMGNPELLSNWPKGRGKWLRLIPTHLLWLKFSTMFRLAFLPESKWLGFGSWTSADERRECIPECRIVLLIWTFVVVAALSNVVAFQWFLLASLLSNTFIGLWLTAEHRGLPYTGSIMERTRTTKSNAFVRWWLWNANYHAEHHAWPSIPWHQLPRTHELIQDNLEHHVTGYIPVHINVLNHRNLPTCDAPVRPTNE